MQPKRTAFAVRLIMAVTGTMIIILSADAAFLQKQFVVCQDQGKDVLCDAYVVRKNDYVTKLFQQRGEIAYRDFPMFLEIFKRLNPTVKDIDLIYPNQRILVPLRLIEPDSLEGQATGTVIIPLITITNIPRQLQQNSMNYVVQQGDTVSALIAQKFGRFSTRPYKEAVEIFKYLNPEIKDLNLIHVGQAINVPVATVRDESWYPELFDDAGELMIRQTPVEEVAEVVTTEIEAIPVEMPVVEEIAEEVVPPEEPEPAALPVPSEETIEEKKPAEKKAEKPPEPKPLTPLPSIFKKAAAIFGAELLGKGEYFFPRPGQADLALDLAATPVMEFASGLRILFAKTQSLSLSDQAEVAAFWKNLQIVTMSYDASLRELLYTICRIIDPDGCENSFSFKDQAAVVTVRGDLIFDNPNGSGKICISMIARKDQKTSDAIYHYLAEQQVVLSEWIDDESHFGPVSAGDAPDVRPGYVTTADTSRAKAFIKDFAAAFLLKYQENVEVSFPYAGFQVKAYSNLLTVAPGREFLLDFGDLQGDAIESIAATGFQVLAIDNSQDYQAVMSELLRVMPVDQQMDPVFWGADISRVTNVSIQVPGRLITLTNNSGKINVLFTDAALNDHILSFLSRTGVRIVKTGN